MKNIKFTNNPNWALLNNIIPEAKECLKNVVQNLNTNKFSACIAKPSRSQYYLKVKAKVVLTIAIISDSENKPCLQLCFINSNNPIYVDSADDFNNAINNWYKEFMQKPVLKFQHKTYVRKSIHSIEEVLSKTIMDDTKGRNDLIEFDGDKIHMASDRYKTFLTSGTKCVNCGLKAKYFAKERNWKHIQYHFNLYGTDANNEEVLFTKDHIIPKKQRR